MTTSQKLYDAAFQHNKMWEWAGAEHNPQVLDMFSDSGHPEIKDDETPWCAAFVGAIIKRNGGTPTGSLLARSYEKWGTPVELSDAQRGDVVVLSRGNSTWQGHVGFFSHLSGDKIYLLGGNQRNQVNITGYKADRLVAIRRAKPQRTNIVQSTTIQAVGATAVSGAGATVTAIGGLDSTTQAIVIVFIGIALLGLLWIARERVRKWSQGDK